MDNIEKIRWDDQVNCWVVSGNALVRECFAADSRALSSNFANVQRQMLPAPLFWRFADLQNLSENVLTQQDGVYHDHIRAAITPALNRVVKACRPRFDEIVEDQISRLPRQFDLVTDVADPIAKAAICEVMNVPAKHRGPLIAATLDVLEYFDFDDALDGVRALKRAQVASDGLRRVRDYFEQEILRHDPDSPKGFVGVLLALRDRQPAPGPSDLEVLYQATTLFMAGFVTTTSLISQAIGEDGLSPAEMIKDPDAFRLQFESLVRRAGPTRFVMRRAISSFTLGGVDISAGDMLQLRLDDANFDSSVYGAQCPISSVQTKESHVTFGEGLHVCPGASMARLILMKVLTTFGEKKISLVPDETAPLRKHDRFQSIVSHSNWSFINGVLH